MGTAKFLEARVVATTNITLNSTQTIDGIGVVANDHVLVVGQTSAQNNGLYVVVAGGNWTRYSEADTAAEFLGMTVVVREGTAYRDTMWQCLTDAITLGTTALTFAQLPASADKAGPALPSGSAQALTDADQTLGSARRSKAAAQTTANVRTKTVPNGSINGERRTIRREATSRSRLRFVNADGSQIAWLNGVGAVELEWDSDASKWFLLSGDRRAKVFFPEDFGAGVGVGNATADTAAILAMRDAIYTYGADQSSLEMSCEVRFEAPEYLVNQQIDFYGTDWTSMRFCGGPPGWSSAARGTNIRYTGPDAVAMSGSPLLTFNRSARTIVRSTGSWVTDGFTVGMAIYVDKIGGINRRIHDRITNVTSTTLTLASPVSTTPTVPFDTAGMAPTDEVSASGYSVVQALSVLHFVGMSGFELRDLVIHNWNTNTNLDGHALWAVHVDIRPDVEHQTNATHFRFVNCNGFGSKDVDQGAVFAIGRPQSDPSVGSQCDTGRFMGCGIFNGYVTDHKGRGIAFLDGNNTKDFWIDDCQFSSCRIGVDHYYASETIRIASCQFESCNESAVVNNGQLHIEDCQAERCAATVKGPAGATTMSNCSWNLMTNQSCIVFQQSRASLDLINVINGRTYLDVTSVDTSTNVLTVTNQAEGGAAPVNGDLVVVRSVAGDSGIPIGVDAEASYTLGDVTSLGGSSYSCKLYDGTPAVVDLKTAGTSVSLLSPSIFQINDLGKASDVDQTGLTITGSTIWAARRSPLITGSNPTVDSLASANSVGAVGAIRAHVQNCFAFTPGRIRSLREVSSVPRGYLGCAPHLGYYRQDANVLHQGLNTEGWSAFEFDYLKLKNGSGSLIHYVLVPYRCGIIRVVSEVVPDGSGQIGFAGGGLSGMTLQAGVYHYKTATVPDPDNLLTPHNILSTAFTNASDRRWGFKDSERGVDLQTGKEWWQKDTGATDYGWAGGFSGIQVLFTLTGGSLSGLTQGRVRLHVKCEQVPEWDRS